VGSGRAEYVSGDPLVEPTPYEEEEKKREPEVEAAAVQPPETEMRQPARRRRG